MSVSSPTVDQGRGVVRTRQTKRLFKGNSTRLKRARAQCYCRGELVAFAGRAAGRAGRLLRRSEWVARNALGGGGRAIGGGCRRRSRRGAAAAASQGCLGCGCV
eukprot:275130-Pyramimonas_sp.AAC.1